MQTEIEQFIYWTRTRSPLARTWRDYQSDLHLFTQVIKGAGVREILPQHLDGFVKYQLDEGYKPSTVNRRLAAVVSLYRYLIREGKAHNCPVLPKRHYLREPERLPRPVNEVDLRKYFSSIHDVRDRAMFTLMLRCGLRIGEVSDLKLTDLFLGEAPSRMIIHGKGSRERTVFLSPETERCLQHWLDQRPPARDDHVFLSYQHHKLSTSSITVRINHVRMLSGVDLTAHRLRHTFANHLLSAGMPITSIQKLMGHRFVETTQNYAVANDLQVQADFYKACRKLDGWELLLGAGQSDSLLITGGSSQEEETTAQDFEAPPFLIPTKIWELPAELVHQLEAYRRLKVNHWRSERIPANSLLFFSQQGILWRYFYEACGINSAPELHLEHVRQFIQSRSDAGRSASTINGSLSSLRSFLSFLQEDGIQIDPSLDNIQRLKQSEHLPRYITSEQMLRVKNEIDGLASQAQDPHELHDALLLRSIFYLLWQGGLRSGEVELLRFSDFYLSESSQAKRLFVRDGKWRKGRAVYLTDTALDALRAYVALRGVENAGDLVFIRNGAPLKRHFIASRIGRIGKQVDVRLSPHRLRHTFATQLLNVGCRVTSIQKLLGHTNLNTTMVYARAFDQTVMADYFQAMDIMETQPDGMWFALNEI